MKRKECNSRLRLLCPIIKSKLSLKNKKFLIDKVIKQ